MHEDDFKCKCGPSTPLLRSLCWLEHEQRLQIDITTVEQVTLLALLMKVICAGIGKTGTKSIAKALRHLGFTVFDFEEQTFDFVDHWVDVFQNGAKPDVKRLYQNADACTDMPGNLFFEEILEAFPDCKVILSVREEDSWIESVARQLDSLYALRTKTRTMLSPTARKVDYVLDSFLNAAIGSCNTKSTYVIRKGYRIHNQRVKSIVRADKLLVYNVKEGWKPLCDFLECDVPTIAFPRVNVKAEITKTIPLMRYGQQMQREVQRGLLAIGSLLVIIVALILAIFLNY